MSSVWYCCHRMYSIIGNVSIVLLRTPLLIPYPVSHCCRMEESTPHSTSWSKSVLVLSTALLLVKGVRSEELVLPSLPPPAQRRREREELVCGTVSRLTGRQNSLAEDGSVWSEEGRSREGGGAGRGSTDCPLRLSALSLSW